MREALRSHRLAAIVGWSLVCLAAWLAYRPGLSGGFLFDDYVNLDAIGRYGDPRQWDVFLRYVTSGTADPIGRPLSLLSFLVDAHDWPADPAPFLRTNLAIHLANATLLFALLCQLGRALGDDGPRRLFAAGFGAGAWLLHPLFVSTTLYIVQRHAMLPTTFCLLGLLAYGTGRTRFSDTGGRDGKAWMVGGLALGTLLATLSKANGILLPLLAAVLESCVFRRRDAMAGVAPPGRWHLAMLALPSLAVLAYVAEPLGRWSFVPAHRGWSVGERVMTEGRVLVDYLHLLVVPRSVSPGLFNDAFPVSQGWLHPWTTLASALFLAALLAFAAVARRRLPALSCAILFYLGGHLLESTTLPLELYFEHRNYLPALLAFWPLGRTLAGWNRGMATRVAVAATILALLGAITHQRSSLWGNPQALASLWAVANPDSGRAQVSAAISFMRAGRPDLALARLEPEWRRRPGELQIGFNVADARCALGGLPAEERDRLTSAFRTTPAGALLMHRWLAQALDVARQGRCRGLDLPTVERWIDAAQENPSLGSPTAKSQDLEPLRARLALARGEPEAARRHFDAALRARFSPDTAAGQAAILASAGHYEQALAHLDLYEQLKPTARRERSGMDRIHAWVLDRQGYWPREMALLRAKLDAEIRNTRPK